MKLFDRLYKFTLYRPDGRPLDNPAGFVQSNTNFFELLTNGLEISATRIQFQIDKSISKDPNTCDVTLFNLSEQTRATLKHKPLTARLDAGYDGVTRLLFLGNINWAISRLNGQDWETKIQLADGGRAFSHARAVKSYKAGTPVRTLLKDAATGMGLKLPPELAKDKSLDERIPKGTVFDGPLRDELTRLLAPYGYTWSTQSGQLQILQDNQTRENLAWVINENDAGLVGTPEYGTPDKKTGKSSLTFSCLLFPELVPGSKVRMESRSVNGFHRIQKVSHEGDSREGAWNTNCEARPL